MNKEEILAKARKENKGKDVADLEIQSKAKSFAGGITLTAGAVMNLIGEVVFDRSLPEFWVMFFCYWAVMGIVQFILNKKNGRNERSGLWLAYGIFMAVMTVLAVIRLYHGLITGDTARW